MSEYGQNFLLQYPLVKTKLRRDDPKFISQRGQEYSLTSKLRHATGFCKGLLGITTSDSTKITESERASLVNCLEKKFLQKDPNYFGKRNTIYIDLHDY